MSSTSTHTTASLDRPLLEDFHGDRPLKALAYLYRGQRRRLALTFLCFAVKHSPAWLMPAMVAKVIDVVSKPETHSLSDLKGIVIVLAVILVQNVPLSFLYVRLLSQAARTAELELRAALCQRLQQLSIGYYARHSVGTLQSKVLRDVESVDQLVRSFFDLGLVGLFNITFALIITGLRQPWFLAYLFLTVPVQILITYALHGRLSSSSAKLRGAVERMSNRIMEMTHVLPVTRAHGLETAALRRVGESLEDVRQAGLRVDGVNATLTSLSWAASESFYMACLIFPAVACLMGWLRIGPGDAILLANYFGLIIGSVLGLVGVVPQITRGLEAIRSIGEVLQCPDREQNEGKAVIANVRGEIRFERVGFVYPGSSETALSDFSLSLNPGETVALVGPSGAGKSTVLNLAIGFIRPTSGRILIDGRDMEQHDLRTYRRFISAVPQESLLFNGTVRENVTYGLPPIPDGVLEAALRDANAWDFVSNLPEGPDTLVGEKGAKLSGGQRQRLAIARALIRNPRVLILDEATSSLDTESEALVQQALTRLRRGRTTLVVAHRLSTVRDAHRIVVLDHGRLVEVGVHESLLSSGGLYARFQDRQAGVRHDSGHLLAAPSSAETVQLAP